MKIEIIKGFNKGQIFQIKEKEIVIGRDKNCKISINDTKSSRKHAKIYLDNEIYIIEDLNSTNGIILNGKTIFKSSLSDNDEILIGDTILEVSEVEPFEQSSSSTSIHIYDEASSTVIVSALHHREADLLSSKTSPPVFDDLILENKILRKVCEISQQIATKNDIENILSSVLDNLQETLYADTACILVWSECLQDWEIKASSSNMNNMETVTISRTIIQQALDDGMSILTTNPMTDGRFDPSMSIISEGISSALCSPLKMHDKFLGVLFIDRRNRDEVFHPMDLRLSATVANMLGLLLENENLELESRKKARLAVIGEVIAGLAHYTKNIITGLRFSINAMEIVTKKRQFETIEKCLKSISTQERRISELVLNMLSYSKDRVPSREFLDIKLILEDLVVPYEQHFQDKNITLEIDIKENTPKIFADEIALHRVFLNLLMNAIDSFKSKQKDNKLIKLTVRTALDSKMIEIIFHDTGCGIPASKLEAIFTVFFSTKGSEGTGLGLAVVHKIINEHQGSISVTSIENEWTEFKITLPVVKPS